MPLYDYVCQDCHQQFEARHRIDAQSPNSPGCGGTARKVILCAPAVRGHMAQGRELAMRSLEPKIGASSHAHGAGCGCGAHHGRT
jgi:putative FmdB family regulatory protein